MPSVRFIPDERGEDALRALRREPSARRVPELWAVTGTLELDVGLPEALRLSCGSPVRDALEPLSEVAHFVATGRANVFSRVLGTAAIGRSSWLYHRWRGEHEAVVTLGHRDSTVGVTRDGERVRVAVLETDDQPQLEDESASLSRAEALGLPALLWDDLDALLGLLEIELDPRERAKWLRLRPEPEGVHP